ncbi:MAG: hypothetical protein KGZ86_08210 [Candidatus Latescibacteria bacterium]|nr:hypothetical protein [Candidatus Latescibacterota bacterium]MBS4016398.1 hypothetical protein [Candidatus Latescibacterota bacterium]
MLKRINYILLILLAFNVYANVWIRPVCYWIKYQAEGIPEVGRQFPLTLSIVATETLPEK